MKKILLVMAAVLLLAGSMNAQNKFRGIVRYELKSVGNVAMTIPADQSTMEVKVYDDQAMFGQAVQNGLRVTQCIDYSPYLNYLASKGGEMETYTGDGKFLIRATMTKETADSLAIVDTEPGHYYIEYVAGETKQLSGFAAKKAIFHIFNDEGTDEPFTIWYSDEIGPEYNYLFGSLGGIKGMPLEFVLNQGEGKAIGCTVTEIVKGKVKEADLLLPAGYKEASEEELETFMTELKDAFELIEE